MDRNDVATVTAQRINAVERSLDDTYAEVAEFAAYLTRARQDAGFAASVGHPAIAELTAGLGKLAEVREHLGKAHGELSRVKRAFRLQPSMIGGVDKEPDIAVAELRRSA